MAVIRGLGVRARAQQGQATARQLAAAIRTTETQWYPAHVHHVDPGYNFTMDRSGTKVELDGPSLQGNKA